MRRFNFNSVYNSPKLSQYLEDLNSDYNFFRQKKYSNLCLELLSQRFPNSKLFLTHSATGGLEMIAQVLDLKPGDEIVLPSYTFVSTANAFVSYGAKPVFVDSSPSDFNLDVSQVEANLTPQTRAVVITHYGGHPGGLSELKAICEKRKILLVEDAAMAYGNYYGDKPCGSFGDFGVISFDITKHITAIQGGLLLVNNLDFAARLENIYHNGTNRTQFQNQEIPYYEWVDKGSKYQMNEMNSVVLYDNLRNEKEILAKRLELSSLYFKQLQEFGSRIWPAEKIGSNFHLFYFQTAGKQEREALQKHLEKVGVEAFIHYVPLHISAMGRRFFSGRLAQAEHISDSILRLPFHQGISAEDCLEISNAIKAFYRQN
jgi:dTDP-4-amino-4,6-dideoxygalactose transaminase